MYARYRLALLGLHRVCDEMMSSKMAGDSPPTWDWGGHSFGIHEMHAEWYDVPGIYVFAARSPESPDRRHAKYVGSTGSFRDRFADHGKWSDALRLGATHVHALVEREATRRVRIESDLIATYLPPLNDRHP